MAVTQSPPPTLTDLLFEKVSVGLCLVAPDSTIVRVNSEWLRSTGFSNVQVVGENISDLSPAMRDMALAIHARARTGHRVEVPRHAQTVNGRETWWEGSIEPVPMQGGTGLLITAREVPLVRALEPGLDSEPDTGSGVPAARTVPAVDGSFDTTWAVRAVGVVALLIGTIHFAAWMTGVGARWAAQGVLNVKTNMSFALMLAGVAVILSTYRPGWIQNAVRIGASFLVLLIGLLTLIEHALHVDFHIDQLLATEPAGAVATTSPNRFGLPGSISLALLGLGLLSLHWRRRITPYFGVATLVITSVPAVGFIYGVSLLYSAARTTAIAWQTVLALSAVAVGLILSKPSRGEPAPVMWRDDAGGAMLRRAWVPTVLVPIVLGWLRAEGERLNLYSGPVGDAAMVVALIVFLSAMLWRSALSLSASTVHQRRTEIALRRRDKQLRDVNEQLREADRRKDEFLSTLSHELRNPLAPIRNSVHILHHAEPTSDQARRARTVIDRQSEHLTRLVDDLLDVTRIVRGKVLLHRARVDLRDIVSRAAEDVHPSVERRGVHLRVTLPKARIWADADATRIAQVLGNLLSNAAKFTPAGGEITVTLSEVNAAAEISVHDTGAGIDPELLPNVFDAFVQGKRTLARSEGGLGLGLALVKGLVELHGGSVRAHSEGVGRGSEFVVTLPLIGPLVNEVTTLGRTRSRTSTPREVLVIDDNADAAQSLAELVELLGHRADVAYDGPTAIEKARLKRPDVVLCDIGLPGITGYDVARALRSEHPTGLRLVAISGYAQPDDVERAKEAGFDAHVAKPPDPAQIERLLA